jgi:hypothetical protein
MPFFELQFNCNQASYKEGCEGDEVEKGYENLHGRKELQEALSLVKPLQTRAASSAVKRMSINL